MLVCVFIMAMTVFFVAVVTICGGKKKPTKSPHKQSPKIAAEQPVIHPQTAPPTEKKNMKMTLPTSGIVTPPARSEDTTDHPMPKAKEDSKNGPKVQKIKDGDNKSSTHLTYDTLYDCDSAFSTDTGPRTGKKKGTKEFDPTSPHRAVSATTTLQEGPASADSASVAIGLP